jgi:transposase
MGKTNKAISAKVLNIIIQNHIRVLPLSPGLSPIEHLWDELGRRVLHRSIPPETQ